jgi:hypothetical protein
MIIEDFYLENYEVTICGKIFHKEKKNMVKTSKATRGYLTCSLYNGNLYKTFYVHRLVALTHIPKIEGKHLVNHKDGNKTNNNITNLEWMTPRENSMHSIRVLKKEVGEKHSRCRLPNEIVLGILSGKITNDDFENIAQKYGVGITHLKNIKAGRKRTSIELFS